MCCNRSHGSVLLRRIIRWRYAFKWFYLHRVRSVDTCKFINKLPQPMMPMQMHSPNTVTLTSFRFSIRSKSFECEVHETHTDHFHHTQYKLLCCVRLWNVSQQIRRTEAGKWHAQFIRQCFNLSPNKLNGMVLPRLSTSWFTSWIDHSIFSFPSTSWAYKWRHRPAQSDWIRCTPIGFCVLMSFSEIALFISKVLKSLQKIVLQFTH
jgi:hypothetical protein